MSLIEHYGVLRQVHVAAVGVSLSLFALRGVGVLLGQGWPLSRLVRLTSVSIDTLLLAAGVGLWVARGLDPLGPDRWLGLKLLLLLAYIVLGSFALKRARTRAARAGFYALSLACAAYMVGVALAHHPAGWFKT